MDSRPVFKPSRPRASMSALPSGSASAKENERSATQPPASSPGALRRKRGQSLGGDALEAARKMAKLGPLNVFGQARERRAPRKSILRAQGAIFEGTNDLTYDFTASAERWSTNHTIDLGALSASQQQQHQPPRQSLSRRSLGAAQQQPPMHDDSSEEELESEDDGSMSMEMTMTVEEREREARRKSLAARRVSFAPNAHIRTFTPDKPTAQAQSAIAAHKEAMKELLAQAGEDGLPFIARLGSDSDSSRSGTPDESVQEGESMELAGEEVTRAFGAFANHFAGTNIPADIIGSNDDDDDDEEESTSREQEESFDSNGSMDMDEATGEITRALGSQSQPAKPRFSEVARQEDREDEELMRELGLVRPSRLPVPVTAASTAPGKSVGFGGVPSDEDEGEDEEDDDAAMEMTTAIGELLQAADPPVNSEEEESSDESMMDQSADMQDATMHGGIIAGATPAEPQDAGVPTPSTASARLQAALFARQSINGANAPPTNITVPEPPRSPRRLSPSPQPQTVPPAPPKSPVRARVSLAPPKSPAQPKIGSPLKKSYVPSSDSAAPSTPPKPITAPSTPAKSPRSVPLPATTPRSASRPTVTPRSATKVAFGTAVTPRTVFAPKAPASAARSPGGGLSLRAAMSAPSPRKSLAAPSPIPAAAVAAAPVVAPRAVEMVKAEVRAEDDEDEDLTSSSYGFEAEAVQLEPLSLDGFIAETGLGFHKDIVGMAGLDLSSGTSSNTRLRRMSLAPPRLNGANGELSGPPTLAELAVAGGSRSLLHQLYAANQANLEEKIRQTQADQAAWEELMQHQKPELFDEWQRASEPHRETMKAQFRDIKTFYYLKERVEWNEYRADNYNQIIEIMEDNLAGLQRDSLLADELTIEDVLPELEQRRELLLAELLDERARDLELSACDQDELNDRHAEVAEQGAILDGYNADRAELEGQLNALQAKTADLKQAQASLVREAEDLQRRLDEGRCFTKAEVFRLQGEFEALQELHGWRLVKFDQRSVTLSHFEQFELTASLAPGGLVLAVELRLLTEQRKAKKSAVTPPFALGQLEATLTAFLFNKLSAHVEADLSAGEGVHIKVLLHRVAALWTNARRIHHEARQAHLRHPVAIQLVGLPDKNQELVLHAEVHSAPLGCTVFVKFELTGEELVAEEGAEDSLAPAVEEDVLGRVGSEVKVKFGRAGGVDVETLKYVVRERLDSGERGAFVRACDDVELKMAEWAQQRAAQA